MTTTYRNDTISIEFACEWIGETFGYFTEDASYMELMELVERSYEGGWSQLAEDAHSVVFINR